MTMKLYLLLSWVCLSESRISGKGPLASNKGVRIVDLKDNDIAASMAVVVD